MAPLFHTEAMLPGSISPKISVVLQSHVYPRVGRVFRALARFKSLLLDALSKTKSRGAPWRPTSGGGKQAISYYPSRSTKRTKIAGLMKPHLVWAAGGSSARVRELDLDVSHVRSCCYGDDSSWSVVAAVPASGLEGGGEDAAEYCGYLRWLEEEETPDEAVVVQVAEEGYDDDVDAGGSGNAVNEIDRLAEKFIARCRAKFLREKQESYRRYQEMMARSM